MEYVSYSNITSYGRGGITWKNEEDTFSMEVNVPVSCHASVYIPTEDLSMITEGGISAEEAAGVAFREIRDGYAIFEVESGNYKFRVSR